jgi:myo-inositol 2-dehydrogenase / D-chiro-inositol 1-dehydrogenase
MQVALIGAGTIGALHARLLCATDGVDVVTVADAMPGRAAAVAAEVGAQPAASIGAALDRADAVVIAAATEAHAALIREAIGRRLPTFCEKPLAIDLDDTIALTEEIDRSGIPFQIGFQRRFDPAYREAHRLVESGELGTLYLVRLIAHDADWPPASYIPALGGLFRDSSIHDFDAIRFVTGAEVSTVYAVGANRIFPAFERSGDIDTVGAVLTMDDGALGILSQTRRNPRGYDVRMELVGSGDAVSMGVGPRMPSRSLEPDAPPPVRGWASFLTRFETAYRQELQAFIPVARGEAPSLSTARDGLAAMRIAVAATRSVAERRAVELATID